MIRPDRSALLARLTEGLGETSVVTDPERLAPRLLDERGTYRGQALCLLLPEDTAAVARAVRICAEAGAAIVPQGGNTGLCGGATPFDGEREVLLGLDRLRRIRERDAENFAMTVEAGLTLAAAQQAAAEIDRLFPLSLGAEGTCQIGGVISTNAGGIHVLHYGTTRDLVLGLEVVLPDGEVWDGLGSLRKDNTGYALKQLFIGAEGTLGIVTAATLRLFPRPRQTAVAFVALPDPAAAVSLLALAREGSGDRVTACEILPRLGLEFCYRHVPDLAAPLDPLPPWALILELSGAGGEDLGSVLADILTQALEQGLAQDAAIAQNEAQAAAFWKLREAIVWAQRPEGASIKHDVAVPVGAVPCFLAEATAAVQRLVPGIRPVPFGHVGDGNIHFNLSQPEGADPAAYLAQQPEVNRCVHDIVRRLGGSISAEHGLGLLRRDENRRTKPAVEMRLQQAIKSALDPHGLMNPGKVLPPL